MSKDSEIKVNQVYEYVEDSDAVDYYGIYEVDGKLVGVDMYDDSIKISIDEIKSDHDYTLIGNIDDLIVLLAVYG